MACESSEGNILERILQDPSAEPSNLPLSLLEAITNNFSENHKIGTGGFAVVYKGSLQNGIVRTVAVKKLSEKFVVEDKTFYQELHSLMKAKHKNIVRFLGYCANTEEKCVIYEGKNVMADIRQKLLCFEFMPKGSLDQYITDACQGLEWKTRYRIIKGICEGLHYLHDKSILHLDLKPANILLNDDMEPKIADFGLSRFFDVKESKILTSKLHGTLGYMAPECFAGVITPKVDIYSIGMIILEILTGQKHHAEVKNVLESWKTRVKASHGDAWLEHVRVCTEIGIKCIDSNPKKRPVTGHIIEMLNETERIYGLIETDFCTSLAATHAQQRLTNIRPSGRLARAQDQNQRAIELSPLCRVPQAVTASPEEREKMVDFNLAETAAGGNLQALIKKLACLTLHRGSQLWDVSDNIEFLKKELEILHAVLCDLSNEERPTEGEKLWKNKIRELSYDMEDVIDKFMLASNNAHAQTSAQDPSFLYTIKETIRSCTEGIKRLLSNYGIATKIQPLKKRFSAVEDRRKRLRTERNDDGSSYDESVPVRDLARYAAAASLVGTEAPCQDIIRMLTDESSSSASAPKVVAIVGFGGLGKTTLAKRAYEKIHGNFNLKAFVFVSREPDINKVLVNILVDFGLKHDFLQRLNTHQLIEEIRKCIRNKRYLLVVDDIWSKDAWEYLQTALFNNNTRGSKIIVTTRDTDVALACCSSINKQVYRMKPLNDDDSKQLFLKKAFNGKECPRNLEEVSRRILKKCAGSPLAILTLSLLVSKVTQDQWEHVLNTISKDSEYDVVRRIISFSYFDLPQHLRTCLLYFAVFPEDTVIKRKPLLNKWIAEGLIRSKDGRSKTHIAEDYFNQLIGRSLILPVDIQYDGQARACRVHDTILEFIIYKALEENFVSFLNRQSGNKVRRLTIQNFQNAAELAEEDLSSVRSLTIFGNSAGCTVPLRRCTNLRVLDAGKFSHYPWANFFDFDVAALPYLKYLDLKNCQLPEEFYTGIGNLQYLETLDLRGSYKKKLRTGIYKLQRLVRLFIDAGVKLSDGIGQMKALEELKCVSIFESSSLKFLQELGQLTKLGSIGIHIESGEISPEQESILASSLEKLSRGKLHSLSLDVFSLEGDVFPPDESQRLPVSDDLAWRGALQSLRTLRMKRGYFAKVPDWMGSLSRLEKLVLVVQGMEQNDLDILGELPNLLYLWLIPYYPKERLTFRENKGFHCLRYLIAGDDVTEGKMVTFQSGSLWSLQDLVLNIGIYNRDETTVPGGHEWGIEHLHSLTTVNIIIRCPHGHQREDITTSITNAVNRLPNNPMLTIARQDIW